MDPTNHDVVYVSAGGLNKSIDGGATWMRLPVEGSVVAVAVSPADPAYVHTVVQTEAREWHRLRSRDGGETWEQMAKFADQTPSNPPPLDYAIYLFQPHPTDPVKVTVHLRWRDNWAEHVGLAVRRLRRARIPTHPGLKFDPWVSEDAEHLVGGGGAAPGRYYAAYNSRVSPYKQTTGTKLLRAEEGGGQATLLEVDGGGSVNGHADGDLLKPAVLVDAHAYDPKAPDRVFIGLDEYQVAVVGSGYPESGA